jgi:hypothetical protein
LLRRTVALYSLRALRADPLENTAGDTSRIVALHNKVFVSQQRLLVQLRKTRVTMRLEAYRGARLEQICHNILMYMWLKLRKRRKRKWIHDFNESSAQHVAYVLALDLLSISYLFEWPGDEYLTSSGIS